MTDPRMPRAAELLRAGWSRRRVSAELGIPRTTVRRLALRLGLDARNEAEEALNRSVESGAFNLRVKTMPLRMGVDAPSDAAAEALGTAPTPLDRVQRFSGDSGEVEFRAPRFIATLDEAVEASGVDLTAWEVASWECRHYAMATADGPIQASYVKLRLTRKHAHADPARLAAAVAAGVDAALAGRTVTPRAIPRFTRPGLLRLRAINDLHIGGYAWGRSTGGEDWDTKTALAAALAANAYLDHHTPDDATETLLWFGGDLAHFDTPHGTTTGGTQLDLDSRVDLMLQALTQYVVETVSTEAERRPTTVIVSEGNHDKILSKVIRRLLLTLFASHKNVTVREQYTPRQYHRYGATLLGFAHGDGNRQRMVDAMAAECGRLGLWDGARCREFHAAHVHHESAKQKVLWGAEALHGTVVRTHIALAAVDQYHADNAWVGGTTGLSDWYYHHKGAMVGNRVALSHLLEAA